MDQVQGKTNELERTNSENSGNSGNSDTILVHFGMFEYLELVFSLEQLGLGSPKNKTQLPLQVLGVALPCSYASC